MEIWQQYEFQMLPSCRRPARCTPGPDHRPVRGKRRRGKLHLHTCIVAEWNCGMVDGDKAGANWDIIPVTFDRFRIRSLLFSVQEAVWANCRPLRPTKLVGEWGGEYWGCSWLSADSPLGCGSGSPVVTPSSVMKCLLDSSQALMVLLSSWSPCGRNHFLSLPVLGSTHYIMFGFFLILMSFQLVLCLNSFDWITHSQFCFPNWIS